MRGCQAPDLVVCVRVGSGSLGDRHLQNGTAENHRWRVCRWVLHVVLVLVSVVLVAAVTDAEAADRGVGQTEDGFGRIVLTFTEMPGYELRTSTGVVTVLFDRPVELDANEIADALPDYVAAGRLDPDGRGIRFALAQSVSINRMEAGRMLFIDLLPSTWRGGPPPLPQSAIDELKIMAEHEEERRRQAEREAAIRNAPSVDLRVFRQPTFTRFAFVWEDDIDAVIARDGQKVDVAFDKFGRISVGRAMPQLPDYVLDIMADVGDNGSIAQFVVDATADVRGFADGNTYIVDVVDKTAVDQAQDAAIDDAVDAFDELGTPPDPDTASGQLETIGIAGPLVEPMPKGEGQPDVAVANQNLVQENDPNAGAEQSPRMVGGQGAVSEPDGQQPEGASAETAMEPVDVEMADIPVVRPDARRFGASVRLTFSFPNQVPAAAFERNGRLWIALATQIPIDVRSLRAELGGIVSSVAVESAGDLQVVRLDLVRSALTNAIAEGTDWIITIGDLVVDPARPIEIERGVTPKTGPVLRAAVENAAGRHEVVDPETGRTLIVVTSSGPAQNVFKRHEMVELDLPKTAHGIVVVPKADGVSVLVTRDLVEIARRPGLSLSADSWRLSMEAGAEAATTSRAGFVVLNESEMPEDPEDFRRRRDFLINKIATSEGIERTSSRLELATVFLSMGQAAEALGLVRYAADEDELVQANPNYRALNGVSLTLMGRHEAALREFDSHLLIDSTDAALWRGLALAKLGRWPEAQTAFTLGEQVISSYPSSLQRRFRLAAAEAALSLNDLEQAYNALARAQDLATQEHEDALLLLRGRLAEALKNPEDALVAYNRVVREGNRRTAVEARLRRVRLLIARNGVDRVDALKELESLSIAWRGDDVELETLRTLAGLYAEEGRFRRSFEIMKAATIANSRSPITRSIQDDLSEIFTELFIGDRRDDIEPVDALALFYDFRELTPIGRRGDEVIRALADRLIAVDLLDQAAALLKHQVDERLRGAARAQVAARLAMVHMMNRKPERALSVLARTRQAVLPDDIMMQRFMLEARALSETGRANLAIELLDTIEGDDVERLKGDIYWVAEKWNEAGASFERLAGDAWRNDQPLDEEARLAVLRAGIAYALGGDSLSLGRLRTRFIDKMSASEDAQAFEIVTYDPVPDGREFRDVVSAIAGIESVEQFLENYRHRFDQAPPAEST